MKEFLTFRKLIAPVLIQVIFWLGTASAVIGGLIIVFTAPYYRVGSAILSGVALILLGPVVLRIWAEFMTAVFRIHSSVSDLRDVAVREAYERYEEKNKNPSPG